MNLSEILILWWLVGVICYATLVKIKQKEFLVKDLIEMIPLGMFGFFLLIIVIGYKVIDKYGDKKLF